MNASVEEGIASYLEPRLEAAEITAVVLPGTGSETVPNSQPSVILVVEMPHTVGTLYQGELKVVVSTPAKIEGLNIASHQALAAKVRQKLAWSGDEEDQEAEDYESPETKTTALNASVHAASQYRTAGFFFKQPTDAQDENMWQTVFSITLGLDGPYATAS